MEKHIMILPDEIIGYILQYYPIYKFFSMDNIPPIIDNYINTTYRSLPINYLEEFEYYANHHDNHNDKYEKILYDKIYKTFLGFLPIFINNNNLNIYICINFIIKPEFEHNEPFTAAIEIALFCSVYKDIYKKELNNYIDNSIKNIMKYIKHACNNLDRPENSPNVDYIKLILYEHKNKTDLIKWEFFNNNL